MKYVEAMHRLLYTGTNYDEVKRLCGDRMPI